MITDALDGKIDLIITKSLSRFARNTVDALNVIRKLKVNNIGVYFEKEDIINRSLEKKNKKRQLSFDNCLTGAEERT